MVTLANVALVELVILGLVVIAEYQFKILIQLPDPLLAAARHKAFAVNAQRLAGTAGRAVGPIYVISAAPKSRRQQPLIAAGIEQVVVHQYQQLLLFMAQIAALMLGGQTYF